MRREFRKLEERFSGLLAVRLRRRGVISRDVWSLSTLRLSRY